MEIYDKVKEYTEYLYKMIEPFSEDVGYEQLIGGKWYKVGPIDESPKIKCTCGLDDILNLMDNYLK